MRKKGRWVPDFGISGGFWVSQFPYSTYNNSCIAKRRNYYFGISGFGVSRFSKAQTQHTTTLEFQKGERM
jgi:hypothetical protein